MYWRQAWRLIQAIKMCKLRKCVTMYWAQAWCLIQAKKMRKLKKNYVDCCVAESLHVQNLS
jgi:hypothetical protein